MSNTVPNNNSTIKIYPVNNTSIKVNCNNQYADTIENQSEFESKIGIKTSNITDLRNQGRNSIRSNPNSITNMDKKVH